MIHKRLLLIWCTIPFLLATTFPTLGSPGDDATVRAIRKQYQLINKNSAYYTHKERDLSGDSTEGGELVGYYHQGKLRKIVATYYGETGKTVEEYYLAERNPLFILRTHFRYKAPIYSKQYDPGTVRSITRERFYFQNSHLFRRIETDNKINSSATLEAKAQEQKHRQQITRFIHMLADPPKTD